MSEITSGLMTLEDIDAILEIENLSFSVPWSRDSFEREVNENKCARYIVLRDEGKAIAYAGVWFILNEAHVTNIAVHPDYRGQGLGARVIGEMIQLAADSGMVWMTLEVRRSNAVAQHLYHKFGFIDVGYRKKYYENNEDALIMALEELPEGNPDNDPMLVLEDEEE